MNPSKLKVTELRAELAARGLDTKGNKPVLVERLQEALDKESNNEADEPSEEANNRSDSVNESELYVTSSEETGEEQKYSEVETSEEQKVDITQEVEKEYQEPVEEPIPVAPTPTRERRSRFTDRDDLPPKQEEPAPPREAEQQEIEESTEEKREEEEHGEEERMQVDQEEAEDSRNQDQQQQQDSGEDSKMTEDQVEVKKEEGVDGGPAAATDNGLSDGVKIKTEPGVKEEKREDGRSGRDDRKRKRSSSPHTREWSGAGNNRSSREDEPDLKESDVLLSWYDSDLNLIIDKETLTTGSPMSDAGFAYIWAGARGTFGYTKGKVCYQVKLNEFCDVSHLENEPNPNVLRVGWSALGTSLQLGEEPLSYGFGGTGKISVDCKFKDYGKTFGLNDVVTAYLEFSDEQVIISYAVNEDYLGEAFRLPEEQLKGKALAPHILTKNVRFEVNFGQKEEPWFPVLDGFTFVNQVPPEEAVPGPRRPEKRSECEMIMMCGLPGSGKTYWANNYCISNPDKMYNVIGTNALIDKMKVMGLPRKANYSGRWDLLIEKCTKCLQRLMDMGARRRRNFILDQTNVYPTAQRRKMRNFEGFIRKAVVIVPTDEEFKRRVEQREKEEGKDVPDSAVMEMKANFSLPDKNLFSEVIYTELDEIEAKKLVRKYNDEATSAGFVRKGPGGGGPPPKRFRSDDFRGGPPRHDFRGGPQRSGPPSHHQGGGGYNRNRGPPGGGGGRGGGGGWPPRQGGGGDRWGGGRDNRNYGGGGGGGYGGGGRQNDRPPAGWRGNSMGGGGGGGRGPPRDFGGPDRRGGGGYPPYHGGGGGGDYEGRSGRGGRGPSGGGGGGRQGGGGGYGGRGGPPPDRGERGPSNQPPNKRGGGGHMGGGGGHGGGTSGGSISSSGGGGGWGAGGGGYGGGGGGSGAGGAGTWGGGGGAAQGGTAGGWGGTAGTGQQTTAQTQWGGYTAGQQTPLTQQQQQQQWKGYNQGTGYNQAAGYTQTAAAAGYGQAAAYGNWGQYGYNYGQGWSQNADGTYNYPQNWNWYAQQQQQPAVAGAAAATTPQAPAPAK